MEARLRSEEVSMVDDAGGLARESQRDAFCVGCSGVVAAATRPHGTHAASSRTYETTSASAASAICVQKHRQTPDSQLYFPLGHRGSIAGLALLEPLPNYFS